MKTLIKIQKELKAPKNQFNKFGNYSYRSCEDILEAVKPLLEDSILLLSDEVVNIGDRNYVKAIARFIEGDKEINVSAFACEAHEQKGMAQAQITGSASSYARKYALNGLFLIDDTKDDDNTNTHGKDSSTGQNLPNKTKLSAKQTAEKAIEACKTVDQLEKVAENIKNSTNLSDKEKEGLLSEVDFHYSLITTEE